MPLIGACCELSWCEPVEARVRSVCVVALRLDKKRDAAEMKALR
jgi:hypothetical protein